MQILICSLVIVTANPGMIQPFSLFYVIKQVVKTITELSLNIVFGNIVAAVQIQKLQNQDKGPLLVVYYLLNKLVANTNHMLLNF